MEQENDRWIIAAVMQTLCWSAVVERDLSLKGRFLFFG